MTIQQKLDELREKAEEFLADNPNFSENIKFHDITSLIKELKVHQVELEIQNIELKVAAERLELEKEKYKELYDETPVPYFTLNETGNIFEINKTAADLFGLPVYSFLKSSIFPHIETKSKQRFVRYLKNIFLNDSADFEEVEFVDQKGNIIYAKINAKVHLEYDLDIKLCRCVITNITENKDKERKLRNIAFRNRLLFQSAGEMLELKTINEIYAYVSKSISQLYPDAAVVILKTLPYKEKRKIIAEVIRIDGIDNSILANASKVLGYNIIGKRYKVMGSDLELFKHHKLIEFKNGFEDFFGKQVPAFASNIFEKLLGLSSIYSIGIRNEEKLLAFIQIFTRNNTYIRDFNTIETFVQQASIIINQRRAEKALNSSERRFRSFFEEDKNIKLIIDPVSGKILEANPAAVDFYGYKDILSMNISKINMNPKAKVSKHINRAIDKKQNYFQFKHRVANGEIKDVEVYSTPIKMDDQYVLFSVIHDITNAKRVEKELDRHRRKLDLMFKNSNDTIVLINEEGFISFVSASVKQLTGHDSEELLGDFRPFIHPDDLGDVEQALQVFLSTKHKKTRVRYRHVHKQKEWVWLEAIGQNYIDDELLKAVIINVREISEQMDYEKLIEERNQALEEANNTKDKFFNIISHDIRGPLGAMVNISEYALKALKKGDLGKAMDIIKSINSGLKSSKSLTENLFNWARIQRDSIDFTPEMFAIEGLVKEILDELQSIIIDKQIKINVEVESRLELVADRFMIGAVLRNLISNAIKYSFTESEILITGKMQNNHSVFISVRDFGEGIDEDELKYILDKDYNYSRLGTNNETGTGLGLIVSKEFVEMHKGTIHVKQQKQGVEFVILLPVQESIHQ
jgi:PAS domain S-box-containing protein